MMDEWLVVELGKYLQKYSKISYNGGNASHKILSETRKSQSSEFAKLRYTTTKYSKVSCESYTTLLKVENRPLNNVTKD